MNAPEGRSHHIWYGLLILVHWLLIVGVIWVLWRHGRGRYELAVSGDRILVLDTRTSDLWERWGSNLYLGTNEHPQREYVQRQQSIQLRPPVRTTTSTPGQIADKPNGPTRAFDEIWNETNDVGKTAD